MTTTAGDRLRIPAELARVADLRHFVRDAARAADAPVECLEDLVQAVDEAATNVIIHGYRGEPGWLELRAAVDREGDGFVVTLEDAAPAFDPTACPEPDLTIPPMARRPGGMGVHLIRESTDRMTYRPRPGGGNILTLVRSMRPGSTKEGEMALTTTTESVDGRVPITVLALEGELDASNFEALIDEVRGLYESGTRNLLLDLSGLSFLASSGLVALHSIVRILHGEPPPDPEAGWGALHSLGLDLDSGTTQREVQLAGPQPAVARVLQRTGLDRLFVVHADRAAAIAAF